MSHDLWTGRKVLVRVDKVQHNITSGSPFVGLQFAQMAKSSIKQRRLITHEGTQETAADPIHNTGDTFWIFLRTTNYQNSVLLHQHHLQKCVASIVQFIYTGS